MIKNNPRHHKNSSIFNLFNLKVMENLDQILAGPSKRNVKEIMPQELLGRLQSKADFYAYLDKHRKYTTSSKSQQE